MSGHAAPRSRPPFVGLTGGIGAGKSTALGALRRLGAETLSTDAIVHDLYDIPEVRDAVIARWGPDVAPGGRVERARIAARAFADPIERAWLERLLWPLVAERIAAWRGSLAERAVPPRAAVVEVPLLFEAGMEGIFDATLAVITQEPVRGRRAEARGHEALDERAARQLSQEEKARRATFTVSNDGSVGELERALSEVLAALPR